MLTSRVNTSLKIYLCGPTLYRKVHIGNLRGIYLADILARISWFFYQKKVYFLHNITDTDERISSLCANSKEEEKFSEQMSKNYITLLQKINLLFFPHIVRVSKRMKVIVHFIKRLLAKDLVRIQKDEVYFFNPKFVVWRRGKGKRKFPSPWSLGEPGWHTECAALIDSEFGSKQIDLHLGGKELLFPHHFNENLQFSYLNNLPISRFWLNHELVYFKGEKISKSIQKTSPAQVEAENFLENNDPALARYLLLSRNPYHKIILDKRMIIKEGIQNLKKIRETIQRACWLIKLISLKPTKPKRVLLLEVKKMIKDKPLRPNKIIEKIHSLRHAINLRMNLDLEEKEKKDFANHFFLMLFLTRKIIGISVTLPRFSRKNINLFKDWRRMIEKREFKIADKLRKELNKRLIFV